MVFLEMLHVKNLCGHGRDSKRVSVEKSACAFRPY